MFRGISGWTEEILARELVKRLDVRIVAKSDLILVEALKRMCGNSINAEEVVRLLRKLYFDEFAKDYTKTVEEVEQELNESLTIKRTYYLASVVFAESILGKPVPTSLIFEILRCIGVENKSNANNKYYFLKELEKSGFIKKISVNTGSRRIDLYYATEDGKRAVADLEAFNQLKKNEDRILKDERIKKIVSEYTKEDGEMPEYLKMGKILHEDENSISVLLYENKSVCLDRYEFEKIDSLAKTLRVFTSTTLVKELENDVKNADFKVRAYLVYSYEKGQVRVLGKIGKGHVFEYLDSTTTDENSE